MEEGEGWRTPVRTECGVKSGEARSTSKGEVYPGIRLGIAGDNPGSHQDSQDRRYLVLAARCRTKRRPGRPIAQPPHSRFKDILHFFLGVFSWS